MAYIKKRALRDGSVRWEMRVYCGCESGRPKFKVRTFKREKDAKDEARSLEQMRKDHTLIRPTRMMNRPGFAKLSPRLAENQTP